MSGLAKPARVNEVVGQELEGVGVSQNGLEFAFDAGLPKLLVQFFAMVPVLPTKQNEILSGFRLRAVYAIRAVQSVNWVEECSKGCVPRPHLGYSRRGVPREAGQSFTYEEGVVGSPQSLHDWGGGRGAGLAG